MTRRTVFVTGASQGIGAEIAVAFAREGYDVAVSSTRVEKLSDVLARIEAAGARAAAVQLDVRSQASIDQAMAGAIGGLGRIDVLINNAAVALKKRALDLTQDEWDLVMDTNLAGAFFVTQRMGRYLVAERRPGCIISVASTHGLVALEDRLAYGVAKAGLMHMTRMLAYEWAEYGIRLNAIAPGRANTPSREASLAQPGFREKMLARVPLRRFCEPHEVAAAACYLASPAAEYITGQTLVLDGGLTVY
jgi:2-deoxy-D-gluconate 3-dehydrogenase